VTERTIHFGPAGSLIGTITAPVYEPPEGSRRALLLTNAGIIPRVGPHRINVTLARRAAALGFHGFRFDMAGLGDSQRRESEGTLLQQRVADIRSAMDQLQRSAGIEQFSMIGLCSGADLAHLTALEDPRLDSIVLFDPYLYRTPRAVLNHFFRQAELQGLPRALVLAAGTLLHPKQTFTDPNPSHGTTQGRTIFPSRDEFARRIHELVQLEVKLLFVFSGSSPITYNYSGQFADTFRRFGFVDKVQSAYLPNCDHAITTAAAQSAFLSLVTRWLESLRVAQGTVEPSQERAA